MGVNNEHSLRRRMQKLLGRPVTPAAWEIAAEKGLPYGQVVRVIDILGSLGFRKIALDTHRRAHLATTVQQATLDGAQSDEHENDQQ